MLEVISEDQTDQLCLPAPSRARPVIETLPRAATAPLPMPASTPPSSGQHSQHSEQAPESIADSPLMSLSPSTQYLDPITPTSLTSEVGYEDMIMLALPAGANIATCEPAKVGSASAKTSMAFAARSDNEPPPYTEAMADSTKWRVAIKSELDSHIENGTCNASELPPGKRENSSKCAFQTKMNTDCSLHYKARLVVRGCEKKEGQDYQ